eukprot:m.10921 g.10921  ORF g.10921 m.10921 type:complete len:54 (-) comp8086_c0_seq1:49-210(-)
MREINILDGIILIYYVSCVTSIMIAKITTCILFGVPSCSQTTDQQIVLHHDTA